MPHVYPLDPLFVKSRVNRPDVTGRDAEHMSNSVILQYAGNDSSAIEAVRVLSSTCDFCHPAWLSSACLLSQYANETRILDHLAAAAALEFP